jgi:asparagine synthase (glutamine-hydrolysing)
MCGIAAIFAYYDDAPGVDAGELMRMREQMKPRGPDGAGEWCDSERRVGLGHRRLSIIDLSPAGAQPMLLPERQLAIIFNGEIYNYRDLRAVLEARGQVFRSTSDTEVLLRLYAERGEEMVADLRGMFAFALWDGRKRGLLLARDPLGIKPLYFCDDGKTLRAASQVKALLAGGRVGTEPEPAGHAGFFLWGHVPEPYTLYRSIRALAPGATFWVDQSGRKQKRIFSSATEILAAAEHAGSQLPSAIAHHPISHSSLPASSSELLRSALVDTVKHHLIADVPVGVFLSSGLDSATIAALAGEAGGTLRTVTLGFEEFKGTASDETPLAETIARQYGAAHQTVWVTRDDFRAHAARLFVAMDQPSTDGVNTYFVSLAASRAALKVTLSGLGGDELFGGYPSFREIPRAAGALRWFPAGNVLGKTFRVITSPVLRRFTSPKYAGLLEYGGSYAGAYLLRRGMFMPWELPEILDGEMVRQGWDELQPLVRLEETLDGLRRPRSKVSCLEMCWYMRNQLLRDSDWAGMAHSLEIRVPLVDVALLRSLAPLLAGEAPPSKLDMALTPRSPLPASVLSRPKTGFHIPVREWLFEASRPSKSRGLRGWARHVYAQFAPN